MSKTVSKELIQRAKQRFGIIGNSESLNRAIEVAIMIAPTDVSVLVTGESGVGKESFPQIIHHNSIRKHGPYVAVNCGAIPEGTIDSELFGHKKGSFTDAVNERKGYFEVADGGTIFLDEVGELPLATQARLLRVLESGEFMKVGSSDVQRTDIRVVAATNVDLAEAISKKKFREDLFYRLNTVTIELPPLRERGSDIQLLFRKFASDFADKYQMPPIRLSDDAQQLLQGYTWPGNIRQLRNLVERISVIAEDRNIDYEMLERQLPANALVKHPAIIQNSYVNYGDDASSGSNIGGQLPPNASLGALYTMMREMKGNLGELTQLLYRILQNQNTMQPSFSLPQKQEETHRFPKSEDVIPIDEIEEIISSDKVLTLKEMETKYIELVLEKNKGARKQTAEDLDISERTLYRKLNKE
ncbi:sigma-54 dependent transcriptional regulator [Porphyromonadaceae bacterium W3.11]|nr:sigma-54 dependent transcriptional regulator [Porphyromonadaceae bacterium W3.11]